MVLALTPLITEVATYASCTSYKKRIRNLIQSLSNLGFLRSTHQVDHRTTNNVTPRSFHVLLFSMFFQEYAILNPPVSPLKPCYSPLFYGHTKIYRPYLCLPHPRSNQYYHSVWFPHQPARNLCHTLHAREIPPSATETMSCNSLRPSQLLIIHLHTVCAHHHIL